MVYLLLLALWFGAVLAAFVSSLTATATATAGPVIITTACIVDLQRHFGDVFQALHVLYQELLLDVVQQELLHPLARLLCGLAVALCSPPHVDPYLRDFGALDVVQLRVRAAGASTLTLPPFDVLEWVLARLRAAKTMLEGQSTASTSEEAMLLQMIVARLHGSVAGRLRTVVQLFR